MGFVYFGVSGEAGRAVVAATLNLAERLSHHRRADPDFRYHRTLTSKHYLACERYLHSLYASRRLMTPSAEPWFAIDVDELDHAIGLWESKTRQHLEGTKRVGALKLVQTSKLQLEVSERDQQYCDRLRQINDSIEALTFEKECLEIELKLRIAENAGLRNLVTWHARESLRFDSAKFRVACPELYEEFHTPTTTRYFRLL